MVQPPIAGLGNVIFTLLVKVRVCRRPIRRYDVGGGSVAGAPVPGGGPSISISLPGVDNHDTERRRQIALKALSDRLNKAGGPAKDGKTAWPAMDNQETQPLIPAAVEVHSGTTPKSDDGVADDAVLVDMPTADGSDQPVDAPSGQPETV